MHISDIADRNAFSMAQKAYDSREPKSDPLTEGECRGLEELESVLEVIENLTESDFRPADWRQLCRAEAILYDLVTTMTTRRDS